MKVIPHLRLLTEEIRAFERSGLYRDGFEALEHIWPDSHEEPNLEGLDTAEKAALLLRCGVLAGFLGRLDKNRSTQENSKNLLSKAVGLFHELGDEVSLVEAENGLAMAYLRKGEFEEAHAWIESSFSRDVSAEHEARIESFLFYGLILIETKRFDDALAFLRSVEPFFQRFDDDYLNGCFATNLGIALNNLGQLPEAMQMYNLAKYFHQKSGNVNYLATIENNLANIYKKESRYSLAHECVDYALELLKEARDFSRRGFTYDTKALIFLDEGKLAAAEESVEKGLQILRQTEFTEFLIETLFTKIRIQAAKKDISGAAITFSEAAHHIRNLQGFEQLDLQAKVFESIVREQIHSGLGRILTEEVVSGEELELQLSPVLAGYTDFDAVWITNSHLKDIGLEKGCLALIVDVETTNGDPVAIVESGDDDVICGFLEKDFGLVSISKDNDDLGVFKTESVEILGKIVGFAVPDERENGKLFVRPVAT